MLIIFYFLSQIVSTEYAKIIFIEYAFQEKGDTILCQNSVFILKDLIEDSGESISFIARSIEAERTSIHKALTDERIFIL